MKTFRYQPLFRMFPRFRGISETGAKQNLRILGRMSWFLKRKLPAPFIIDRNSTAYVPYAYKTARNMLFLRFRRMCISETHCLDIFFARSIFRFNAIPARSDIIEVIFYTRNFLKTNGRGGFHCALFADLSRPITILFNSLYRPPQTRLTKSILSS